MQRGKISVQKVRMLLLFMPCYPTLCSGLSRVFESFVYLHNLIFIFLIKNRTKFGKMFLSIYNKEGGQKINTITGSF